MQRNLPKTPLILKASRCFWLVHLLGFGLYMGINRFLDFYYTQSVNLYVDYIATEFVLITGVILLFRAAYWRWQWYKLGVFSLLPRLLIGSWVLALIWQLWWQWQDWGELISAFSNMRAPEWQQGPMRNFIGTWGHHFYMFFAWL